MISTFNHCSSKERRGLLDYGILCRLIWGEGGRERERYIFTMNCCFSVPSRSGLMLFSQMKKLRPLTRQYFIWHLRFFWIVTKELSWILPLFLIGSKCTNQHKNTNTTSAKSNIPLPTLGPFRDINAPTINQSKMYAFDCYQFLLGNQMAHNTTLLNDSTICHSKNLSSYFLHKKLWSKLVFMKRKKERKKERKKCE